MSERPPTWAEYTGMQFRLERELAEAKADRNKYKYALANYRDETIDRLEKRVAELEKEVESLR